MATIIHPTAIVEPGAELGVDCEIHAYAIVTRHAQLADGVVIHPHAVIGGDPQYLKFDRKLNTKVRVGAGTVIRESATVHRSIYEGGATVIGDHCFLMVGAHVGHDCRIGHSVVLANNVLLAGHVTIDDFCFVGGGAAMHQFARVGESAMIGGLTRLTRDVAPYLLVAERDEVSGLNVVGLKRRGFSREAMKELKAAFRAVYHAAGNIRDLAAKALASGTFVTPEARRFLEFFAAGKRGFARPNRANAAMAPDENTP